MASVGLARNIALAFAALCASVSLVACGPGAALTTASPSIPESVTVLAASSLVGVLPDIADAYQLAFGGDVVFSFGASGTLATQVKNGAPADVVIFAGSAPMDSLEAALLIETTSRRDILTNILVVIVSSKSSVQFKSLSEISDSTQGKIAIADPSLAPAGQYAQAAMQSAGVWDKVQSRVIPALDVRAAAAAVSSGNAEFAFVYATDAAATSDVRILLEVPAGSYPMIAYPAAVVASSDKPVAAREFLEFLASKTASDVFRKYGFTPR